MVNNEDKKIPKIQKKEYLVQAWITEDLLNELERITQTYGLTKAVIIRQALKLYVKDL